MSTSGTAFLSSLHGSILGSLIPTYRPGLEGKAVGTAPCAPRRVLFAAHATSSGESPSRLYIVTATRTSRACILASVMAVRRYTPAASCYRMALISLLLQMQSPRGSFMEAWQMSILTWRCSGSLAAMAARLLNL